jgi:hypothetical protein
MLNVAVNILFYYFLLYLALQRTKCILQLIPLFSIETVYDTYSYFMFSVLYLKTHWNAS